MGEKEEAIKLESTLSNRSNRSNRTAGSNGSPAIESAVTKPPTTKIAARLKLAVEEAVIDKNLSPGLVPLAQEYEKLKKQLRSLISCAKTYHQDSIQVQKSRDQLIQNLAMMSQDSPIYGEIGTPLDVTTAQSVQEVIAGSNQGSGKKSVREKIVSKPLNGTTSENAQEVVAARAAPKKASGKKSVREIVTEWEGSQPQVSLQAIQQLASAQGHVDIMEFQSHILDYVNEWEWVVTTRIDAELKLSRKQAADRAHYESKVEALRKKSNELETRGKVTPTGTAEKLKRNEEKLKEAFEIYELAAGKLCVLIEEATAGGWRDLYPLVQNVMKWEAHRVESENDIYAKLLPTSEVLMLTYMESDKSSKLQIKKTSPKKKTKK